MKTTRKLIPAIAMLLVSTVMLTTASYAWFTMGDHATAEGMSVQAEAASSMVIAIKDASTTPADLLSRATDSVSFGKVVTTLKPATFDDEAEASDAISGLKTIENTMDYVDIINGTVRDDIGDADPYVTVAAGDADYYVDYTVLLAAGGGAAIEGGDLIATVDTTKIPEAGIHNALTIMFLVSTGEDSDMALAENGEYNGVYNMETLKDNGEVNLGTFDIPSAFDADGNLNDYVTITMRVYYDGELADANNAGKTYVRNDMVVLTGAAAPEFSVKFTYSK